MVHSSGMCDRLAHGHVFQWRRNGGGGAPGTRSPPYFWWSPPVFAPPPQILEVHSKFCARN